MPDLMTHAYFSEKILSDLPPKVRARLWKDVYVCAAAGPDTWYSIGFYGGDNKPLTARGTRMHNEETGSFLTALARRAANSEQREAVFSYLAGFLCHYALDTVAHPFIFYRTGFYDGTEATRSVRGYHTRLERAIDLYYLREAYGTTLRRFPIRKKCVPLSAYPKELEADLNAVFREVYGWENAFAALNRAQRDHWLLWGLLKDPDGVVHTLAKKLDDGRSELDFAVISYHGRSLDDGPIDYLNWQHKEWRYPADPDDVHRESFPELMEQAAEKARKLIDIVYNYVYYNSVTEEDLSAAIGNENYCTGRDWADPRYQTMRCFDIIDFK